MSQCRAILSFLVSDFSTGYPYILCDVNRQIVGAVNTKFPSCLVIHCAGLVVNRFMIGLPYTRTSAAGQRLVIWE